MTKIDIFSGFLGAGKTTLIKKLIQEAYQGEKLVLIENEFGEIGIDGAFMQDAGIQVNEMNSGCICCSLVGDFGRALKKVLAEYAPDRILIEPSGVGKLSDVIGAVERIDSHDIALNSFTTVVDAKKAKVYMKNFGEFFNNQVESASAIILSRTQDVTEAKLAEVLALLREHNPNAVIITTPWSELDGKMILAAMERKDTLEAALKELTEMARKEEEEEEHEHHHHHHHDDDEECDSATILSANATTIMTMTTTRTSTSIIITIIMTTMTRTSTSTITTITTMTMRNATILSANATTIMTMTTSTSTTITIITTTATTPTRCSPAGAWRRPTNIPKTRSKAS